MTDLQTDTMTPQDETDFTHDTRQPETTTLAPADTTATEARQIGRCKWFSKGYGFIQGLGDDTRDFFVHHTQLGSLDTSQETDAHEFRYLMRGETVEFTAKEKPRADGGDNGTEGDDAEANEDTTNRVMACNVTGIYGGPLMYQTELQEQEEQNARYAARNANQTGDAGHDGEFTTVSHRRHGGGGGKGKGKGKGRYGGKGRSASHRWSTGDAGGGYYGQQQAPMPPQQMGYYGYYGQAPPLPNYGQLHQGFGMQHVPGQAPLGQQPAATGYNNGFSALEE
jgi:cold shock CspA family protein